MKCKLCETRRPRRYCPGVTGDICSLCCGTHREETVDCPLDCVYLQEAHRHERPPEIDPEQIPNRDIKVTDDFLREHEALIASVGRILLEAALEARSPVDHDIRDALEGLVRTYRTLDSGLVYETRSPNPVAAFMQQHFREKIAELQQRLRDRFGMETMRDAEVLGALAFLQRIEYNLNNGRKRSRAFLSFLADHLAGTESAQQGPLVVAP